VRIAQILLCVSLNAAIVLSASAHIGLEYPPSRYGPNILKSPPCGLGGGQRTNNVTTLEPGTTIDIVWDEYIDHPGHFRVAFDADGDDDFVEPACLSGCSTRSPTIELYSNEAVLLDGIADTPDGGHGGARVALPDIECDNCTLQVIQVMYDKPPYRLPGDDLYYQCADLVLHRSIPLTATPTPSATPSPEPPTPSPSPSPSLPAVVCTGDCDGSHDVTVDEIVTLVAIALGTSEVSDCTAGDKDGSSTIEVDEIVAALRRSLDGCGV
jgi:hypothetical protein